MWSFFVRGLLLGLEGVLAGRGGRAGRHNRAMFSEGRSRGRVDSSGRGTVREERSQGENKGENRREREGGAREGQAGCQ